MRIKSEKEMIQLGQKLGETILNKPHQPLVIYLEGNLGAGKTVFSKGILKGINFKELVNSPTYNLIETMETKEFIIYHVDLYRIDSLTQILELELHEEPILEKPYIFLIEWPKNGKDSILPPDLIIKFSLYDDNLNERVLEIKKITEKGRKIDNSWIK